MHMRHSGGSTIVVHKTVNNYITNNDNRVTNHITYNVRTTKGETPRKWIDEKTGLPNTNVVHVTWHKENKKWQVWGIDPTKRKRTYIDCRNNWHEAVALREQVQKTEGTMGAGQLEFTEDCEAGTSSVSTPESGSWWWRSTATTPRPSRWWGNLFE
jgi:hypothetical protein